MKNTVTKEQIDLLILNSEIDVETKFNKTTIVTCKLPNGFIIVESSSCVDPANYDEELGYEICLKRIENKVWELEGYVLQCKQ
jgi:Phage protein (N4 Gp49/phage Sf6 gene 66) family